MRHAGPSGQGAIRYLIEDGNLHLGRGMVFHVTPSNVPVILHIFCLWGRCAAMQM